MSWKANQSHNLLDEDILIVYFEELSETLKPPSLWSIHFIIKKGVQITYNIDIGNFKKLKHF